MKKFSDVFGVLFALVFVVLGICLMTILASGQDKMVRDCTESVLGTVTSVKVDRNSETVSYTAYIEFELDGEKHEFSHSCGSRVRKGDTVKIMYDPDDHSKYYAQSMFSSSTSLRIAGLVFTIGGAVIMFKIIRRIISERRV